MTLPVVGIVMGSQSDWSTMKQSAKILKEFEIPFETKIVSAHRTPDRLWKYGNSAEDRGLKVIGVPITSKALSGVDSLYSIVQMPKGFPVATMAIGEPGANNAALFAISILSINDSTLANNIKQWREKLSNSITDEPIDEI